MAACVLVSVLSGCGSPNHNTPPPSFGGLFTLVIEVPWDVPALSAAPVATVDDQPTERQHAPSWILGG